MNSLQRLTLALLLVLSVSANVQTASAEEGLGSTVKEIFLKGSIDKNKLFMVLGFEKGSKIVKESLKEAVDLEGLKDIGVDLAKDLKEDSEIITNDMIEHIGDAAEFSVGNIKNIGIAPYKSLKKIPQAFQMSLSHAREAYWEGENKIASTMKYAGHAVWASTKTGYYLVIEAPIVAIGHIAATALAVPGAIAFDAARLAFSVTLHIGSTAIKLGWQATKAIYQGTRALLAGGYSLLSTTVAITATSAAAGVIAIYDGITWIATRPVYLFNPARIDVRTEVPLDKLPELARQLENMAGSDEMLKLGVNTKFTKTSLKEFKSSITFFNNNQGKNRKAVKIKLKVSKKMVKVYAFVYLKQVKRLYKESSNSEEVSKRDHKKLLRTFLVEALGKAVTETLRN